MLIIYLVLINAVAFALMLADKHKARKNLWRIPESTLLTAALLGGSLGAIAGMYAARHKTKHLKFSVGLPVILALQVITGIILYCQII
jgi:uncharacterized membrane protein YsdA (DUF1294 family)